MSELADDGILVAVSPRVLKLSRQPYCCWRKQQVTEAELVEAYRPTPCSMPTAMMPSSGTLPGRRSHGSR